MRYGRDLDTAAGGLIPKLLGFYEKELHPVLSERLSGYGIKYLVNVGAADGYYAVGLARKYPDLSVVAYETDERGRRLIEAMAARNGVSDRIVVRGHCDLAALSSAMTQVDPPLTLVLCDVEGYEDILLDPVAIPQLKKCLLLVEIHDVKIPGISDRLRTRFDESHQIDVFWQQRRTAADFPITNDYTKSLAPRHLEAAVDEGRPVRDGATPMCWFWMVPRGSDEG